MAGRRWSDGLHQAVEAKEGVEGPRGQRHLRHDHAAELLPHVRQAGRHDRHGHDGGGGVPQDLQGRGRSRCPTNLEYIAAQPESRSGRGRATRRTAALLLLRPQATTPDTPAGLLAAQGLSRRGLPDRGGQAAGGDHRDPAATRPRPAAARRHDLGRAVGAACPAGCAAEPLQTLAMVDDPARRLPRVERARGRRDAGRGAAAAARADPGRSARRDLRPLARELDLALNPDAAREPGTPAAACSSLEPEHQDAAGRRRWTGGSGTAVLNAKKHDEESAHHRRRRRAGQP